MKKPLLFIAIAIFSISSINAQEKEETNYGFEDKDVFISGSLRYSNEKNGDSENNFFSFRPSVNFFVSENVSINGGLIFNTSNFSNTINTLNSDNSSFGGSLGATYFFTPKSKFSFMLNLNTSYEKINFEDSSGLDTDLNQFGIAFSPGINYFVSKRLALQLSLGAVSYFSRTNNDSVFGDYNRFGFDLNLSSLGLGAIFRL